MQSSAKLSTQELESEIRSLYDIISKMELAQIDLIKRLAMETQRNGLRLAVVIHVYYLDLIEEMCKYLKHIPYPCDFYISTQEHFAHICTSYFKSCFPNSTIIVKHFENVGRDVYPFLFFYQNNLLKYDLVLKIHTKKSTHNNNFSLWREHLMQNLVGSEEIVRRIVGTFKDDDRLGLFYPDHFPLIEPYIDFEMNYHYIKMYSSKIGIEVNDKERLNFPSGTFFWFRPIAFVDLLKYDDLLDDFRAITEASIDIREGLLEHAFERIFALIVKNRNYSSRQFLYNSSAGIKTQLRLIEENSLVDKSFYLETYKDVRLSNIDPAEHYLLHGAAEDRWPCPDFDTYYYKSHLKREPSTKHISPVLHWFIVGRFRNYHRNINEALSSK